LVSGLALEHPWVIARPDTRKPAEHDGDLRHWYYDERLVPGTKVELRRAEPAAGQFAVAVNGDERAIGEKAAAGLFVRPAA
jgi:DtxR family transcriptional regulator, Mn-dependent transcriptional regulator